MALIISHRIKRKEFKRGIIPASDLEMIIEGFKEGIGIPIKGESLPKGSRLIKIYATVVAGARRIVYLVDVESNDGFLLFYRSKNDKIGKNISIKNPEFKHRLHIYLDFLEQDIGAGTIDTYKI